MNQHHPRWVGAMLPALLLLLAGTVRAGPSFESSIRWVEPDDVPEEYAVAMELVDAILAGDVPALRKVLRATDSWPEWKDREEERMAWARERLARGIPRPWGTRMSLAELTGGRQLHLTRTVFDPLVPGVEAGETVTIKLRYRGEDEDSEFEDIVFLFDVLDRGSVLTELRMDDLPDSAPGTLGVEMPDGVALAEDTLLGTWRLTRIRALTKEDDQWRARRGPARAIQRRIDMQQMTFYAGGEGQLTGSLTDGTVVDEALRWRLDEGGIRLTVGDLNVRYVATKATGEVLILAEDPAWVSLAPLQELRFERVEVPGTEGADDP